MNTTLDEDQRALSQLATGLFDRYADPARLEKTEGTSDRFDRELWSALAETGLLGVAVPEEDGGLGLGSVEVALVLDALGRAVAPVPLVDAVLAGWCLAAVGSADQRQRLLPGILDGTRLGASGPAAATKALRADGDRLTGRAIGVPWAHVADVVLLPVGDA